MFALLALLNASFGTSNTKLFREIPDFDVEDDNPEPAQMSDTCAYTPEGWPVSSKMGFAQWYDDCQRPYMSQ
jgi:hypothetical protein